MLMPLLVVNLLTLGAALLLLRSLTRAPASEGPPASFARVLADASPGIDPAAPGGGPQAPEAIPRPGGIDRPPAATVATDLHPAAPLSLADRLAVIRHMLQGRTAEETAALVRAPADAVRTLYLQHGRREGTPC